MGTVFSQIVDFFNRNLIAFFALLLAISAVVFLGFRKLNFDENINSVFPKGEEFQRFKEVIDENGVNRQIMFSIDVEGKEYDEVYADLDSLSGLLIAETKGFVKEIQPFREDQEEAVLNHYYDVFPAFLNSNDYQYIAGKVHPDSIPGSMKAISEKLSSVNSLFLRRIIAKDPLGLLWPKIQSMNPQSDSSNIKIEDGILFSKDHSKAFFTGVLNYDANNSKKNERLNEKLVAFKAKHPNLDYFGTFLISYENSQQIKKDTFVTMIISIGLILLLLVVYYRSLLTPILFILPALFSGFCGLGFLGFIQPTVSAISIATSAVLLGIVLDYTFHFITHYAHTRDLKSTVKELTFPMLVGSFTTIVAFMALLFTDSVVLQNFGLLALLMLSSAAIFTLLFLPTIIKISGFSPKVRSSKNSFTLPKWIIRTSIFATFILAAMFILNSPSVTFDSDLHNLSFHTDELIEKEEYYTNINPREEKKLYFFAEGKTKEEAVNVNFELFQKVIQFHEKNGLEEVISVAPYLIPSDIISEKQEIWEQFWADKIDTVFSNINADGAKFDFSETAFKPFNRWVTEMNLDDQQLDDELLTNLGLSKFVHEANGKWSIATSVVIKESKVEAFKESLSKIDGVYTFDISEMAEALMNSVQADFNYLLIFSSLVVLFSLLVIYGRVELALFSFFPMVVSWVWILYIASWMDIQFNFVNIIVATFIFGLGDDFSIFITDGLIQKYKTNSSALSSYKSAIVLSGVTTIIGTGALYFAQHPAVHSIAIISVVGISCILLVTLLVQPALFNFFVVNRAKKNRTPITLLGLVFSVFLFTYFIVGCIILNVFLLILIVVPISKSKKQDILCFTISKMTLSIIYLGFHTRKRYVNFENIDFSKPSIIIANHSSFLDILVMLMIHPKTVIMVKEWVYNSPFFGLFVRYSGYLFVKNGPEQNVQMIEDRINHGYSIVIFPEGTRSKDGKIGRFHKGAFYLAQEMKLDIQPILLVGINYVNPKNDLIIKSGTLMMVALDRIKHDDPIFNQRLGLLAKEVNQRMRMAEKEIRQKYFNADELKNRVMYNYLYKGPVTEWYVRIKWRFEKKNFERYDALIGNRSRIYDVGCGYGYLGFYLHYRDPSRTITGVDYDEAKIALAQNCHDKSDKLNFLHGDVRNTEVENADVVFFNDVLHYMSKEDQMNVLKKTVNSLNDDGLILIRDGVTDLEGRHQFTEKTERYSTKIISFNKTTGDLSFFSSQDIYHFAQENNLVCEMVDQSSKTSNVLFILRKTING